MKPSNELKPRLWDLLPAVIAVIFAAFFFAVRFFCVPLPQDTVVVEVDGKRVAELSLENDTEYLIEGIGGTNLLIIKGGKAYISEATCPDRVCVKTGEVTETTPSVCRPNRVVVYLEEGDVG